MMTIKPMSWRIVCDYDEPFDVIVDRFDGVVAISDGGKILKITLGQLKALSSIIPEIEKAMKND